jgi:IMP dehydrogenase
MHEHVIPLGLAYDDVLLVPQKSRITSRKLVSTKTKVSRNIAIVIPFVSSNLDMVTESAMAIAMAKLGGIGIIHRFMTIEREAAEVRRVKRSEGFVMGTPFTLSPKQTAAEARPLMKQHNVGSAIVVDHKNKVLGLVSNRDMWFLDDVTVPLEKLMTPASKLITAGVNISLDEARRLFRKYKVEKLPLLHPDRTLGGLITSRTVLNEDRFPHATQDKSGRLRVGAAVGVVGDYLERAQELIKIGVDALVVDIAHIHSTHGIMAVKKLRKLAHNTDIIDGNVATAQAAKELIGLDVDAVKVGIGPGGICITRMVAGAGVPQLTAIMDCAKIAQIAKIPLIADGGTNYLGDMTKALAAGASCVMITGWVAGTDESPGSIILRKGQRYKAHRGAASFSAVASRILEGVSGQVRKELSEEELDSELEEVVAEGVETFVPYKGAAKDVINQLVGAVRSGMSYSNAGTIPELWKNARFIRITPAGFRESKQHNVEEM